jgi:threonylcarbamoyladenosine tRNA methylthiotransferase MtaB
VQDGCNYKCTFCTIPLARGKSRSDTIESVIANAKKIGEAGTKEIVLTGVNLGDFGNGTEVIEGMRPKKEAMFIDLIRELDKVEEIKRFRISSIEPNLCTDEVIEFVAESERFVPHFHMPLQSGNDKQLRMMSRRYKSDLYIQRVKKIKSMMPHCCIGVDVIVGFPGETDEDFLETVEFLENLDISYLHVFTYSERANTPAAEMENVVPIEKRRKRNEILRNLSAKKKDNFYKQYLGRYRDILFEVHRDKTKMTGFTDNYIKVELPFQAELINKIATVQLQNINEEGNVESMLADIPEAIFDC